MFKEAQRYATYPILFKKPAVKALGQQNGAFGFVFRGKAGVADFGIDPFSLGGIYFDALGIKIGALVLVNIIQVPFRYRKGHYCRTLAAQGQVCRGFKLLALRADNRLKAVQGADMPNNLG